MHQSVTNQTTHQPVLLEAVLQYLEPKPGDRYLDLTAGYGGHAQAVIAKTGNPSGSVLVDRDELAIQELKQLGLEVQVLHADFWRASHELQQAGQQFDLILADLGVSSPHLDNASRGFSFSAEAPLDMRMDRRQSLTADTIVNTYSQQQLEDILRRYGEEPKARAIARRIVNQRPFKTTTQLADVVRGLWGSSRSRVHPATRLFQALRIAVNDELGLLERALPMWLDLLVPGGRIAVVSFHSLEDRIVKQVFLENGGNRFDAQLNILTKKPVTATDVEIVSNPRARSAKLRAAVKNKQRKGSLHAYPGQK